MRLRQMKLSIKTKNKWKVDFLKISQETKKNKVFCEIPGNPMKMQLKVVTAFIAWDELKFNLRKDLEVEKVIHIWVEIGWNY